LGCEKTTGGKTRSGCKNGSRESKGQTEECSGEEGVEFEDE
jgi:hypothetical protein